MVVTDQPDAPHISRSTAGGSGPRVCSGSNNDVDDTRAAGPVYDWLRGPLSLGCQPLSVVVCEWISTLLRSLAADDGMDGRPGHHIIDLSRCTFTRGIASAILRASVPGEL
jgi:hypothetical protein